MPTTVDPAEIRKFEEMSHDWWDPNGKFRPLHRINPVRVAYIREHLAGSPNAHLTDLAIADIGCGGGLLSEALGDLKANVVAIDRSEQTVGAARIHQRESGSSVDYRVQSAADLGKERPESFDAVCSMEVLEHVSDPALFLEECAALLKPGGKLFFATLNRTPKSYLMAIVGAEYILNWLPRGTHEYHKFIRPSELYQWLKPLNIQVKDISGISYKPLRDHWYLSKDASVNFVGFGVKQGA
ncbi:MAG: bifunctional 2-polyprenyl-6-hydroxyphenol methylase/3-demethylubiquinol 3-O-methyltransferase UbiG [Magnetococcales bacterium]|nr:bifunctional 2-polyprenyl-6-hydroxyphenol methylase/3-demethylubiquinol 3-O-methyltransferase UbiG [Magnetococcales bacterium]